MRVVHHTISIGCPAELNGREGRLVVAEFYAGLLGMRIIRVNWLKIGKHPAALPQLAFSGDGWSDTRSPRWPDPEYPQQVHLDLHVRDLADSDRRVLRLGGSRLATYPDHRVYADPVGHPFCLYSADVDGDDAVIWRVVFDCPSPRTLARFYEDLVDEWERLEDSADQVVLSPLSGDLPILAFQRADVRSPQWPDPDYPAQLHLDLSFDNENAIELARELGAVHLKGEVHADPAGHPFCLGIWRAAAPSGIDVHYYSRRKGGNPETMDKVRTRLSGPVIGCGDAWELAEFYASLLGWKVVDRSQNDPGGWALVKSPDREHKLELQREEPFVPPVWPTVAGRQQMSMHLDIGVDGLAPVSDMEQRRRQFFEVVDRAKSLGARVAAHQPQPERVLVMLDPAGHPFCLFPGK